VDETSGFEGWFLVSHDAVPERWRSRAQDMTLIPLLPDEMKDVLANSAPQPTLTSFNEALARLVARGASNVEIGETLHLSLRTVERQLAELRERVGVRTDRELVGYLARRGF
jgi:DNA-binding NarL/FixJ family response regulator